MQDAPRHGLAVHLVGTVVDARGPEEERLLELQGLELGAGVLAAEAGHQDFEAGVLARRKERRGAHGCRAGAEQLAVAGPVSANASDHSLA